MIILQAIYHLALFKKFTRYDRWFEVGCSILFWLNLINLLYIILK